MTLTEAHKTGKRYRRKYEKCWTRYHDCTAKNYIAGCDLFADDYEIEISVFDFETTIHYIKSGHSNRILVCVDEIPNIPASELEGKQCSITIKPLD